MSLARITLSGTVVSEPEKRFTPNDHAVTSFTLETQNPVMSGKQQPQGDTAFHVKVTCWRGLAEAVTEQVRKGDQVVVEGRLQMESYQAADGSQKKGFEIDANSIEKLTGGSEPVLAAAGAGAANAGGGNYAPRGNGGGGGYASTPQQSRAPQPEPAGGGGGGFLNSEDLLTEDDIPF